VEPDHSLCSIGKITGTTARDETVAAGEPGTPLNDRHAPCLGSRRRRH